MSSRVLLVSYAADGAVIERIEISHHMYYGGNTPVVDSNAFRSENGVRRLTGEIYNSGGTLEQSFENTYDEAGKYLRGRAVFDDGTVVED
jgi:hypothetical protein